MMSAHIRYPLHAYLIGVSVSYLAENDERDECILRGHCLTIMGTVHLSWWLFAIAFAANLALAQVDPGVLAHKSLYREDRLYGPRLCFMVIAVMLPDFLLYIVYSASLQKQLTEQNHTCVVLTADFFVLCT